ncbi:MAG: flagellar basal body P-ring protein FlgI [Candidatus Margulisbacteria bacterium]|nr:flagellar basal body P-ring protein FlgI [Candidatus Margulisiibacteriota bacterium]
MVILRKTKNLKVKTKNYNQKLKTFLIFSLTFTFLALSFEFASAVSPRVRIKDIAHVLEARENQLMGFGLVVGLRNTGDRSKTGFTQQALTNLISRMGVVPQTIDFSSRNVAAVMVTAQLPPFVKSGQKIDVTISSVGDATSLQGGTLLVTPLNGVDDQVYAVAQGSMLVGIESSAPSVPYVRQRQSTVGRIPNGALVEKEVPVSLASKGLLTIVLDNPDFTTATRVAAAITSKGFLANATDAGTVTVPIGFEGDIVKTIAQIENLTVVPDVVAKIIVNERTGTIVVGESVKIAPVAVSYSGIDVTIGEVSLFSEGIEGEAAQGESRYRARSLARLERNEGELKVVPGGATLSSLVRALNTIGASPKDLIAILQAMKKAGAIKADLEVI